MSYIKSKINNFLFRTFGIPKVKREMISKVVFKKYLPKNPVMIDCGSYNGADSIELTKTLGGVVHAFEAVPSIYKRLKTRTAGNSKIITYNCALSDINGEQEFYISEGGSDASSSLLKPKAHLIDHPSTHFKEVIKVKSITLDTWAEENKITNVDLLWLDMQGFEMDMLKVSSKILPTVKCIHTEVSVRETYEGVKQYSELKKWLESIGFHAEIEAIPQGWDMGNVMFVRK